MQKGGVVRGALHRALEGTSPWGSLEAPGHSSVRWTGWDHYRLTVFPPGTNGQERRALAFNRNWPVWGAVAGLGAEMILGSSQPPVIELFIVLVLYAAGIVLGLTLTRKLRSRIKRVSIAVIRIDGGVETLGDGVLFRQCAAALAELDRRLRDGELTPVQYEAGWAAVYNDLG